MPPKTRIAYFYDEEIGNYYYEERHPMKPVRVRMTHELILAYGLHEHLQVFRPRRSTEMEMMRYHTKDLISYLKCLPNENSQQKADYLRKHFDNECIQDVPLFDNLFEYCQITAGGSICAAQRINQGLCDIAINWAGGMHHAHKHRPSGFCYVADCVLGIMELLKYFPRVMYIDIDIHHGDCVEEAFYDTDRVLTCSFHKYAKDFFPGTGHVYDIGKNLGKFYSVNVPLRDGITDDDYLFLFKPIITKLIEWFKPGAILLQCGADSITGDKLGTFNLSTYGHGECVNFVKSFGIPLLVTGGGGYTKTSVARAWCYETSILTDQTIDNQMPVDDYYLYYGPTYELHLQKNEEKKNMNSRSFLENLRNIVFENLRHLPGAPSVQMQELPPREYIQSATRVASKQPNLRNTSRALNDNE